MKKLFTRSVLSIAVLLLLLASSWLYGQEYYVGELNAGTLSIGDTTIVVEKVATYPSRAKGLGGKEYLKEGTGMFFVFPDDDFHGFWMKDMKFPIDIIWIDSSYKIVDVKKNVTPETYPEVFGPEAKARYVLEVNAGFSDNHAVKRGGKVVFVEHEVKNQE